MAEDSAPSMPKQKPKRKWGCVRFFLIALLVIYGLFEFFMFYNRERIRENGLIQDGRSIGLLLFAYANDHDGEYPEGKTSTEVFQKLIDGGYVNDPANQEGATDETIFYFPMPGKVKPTSKILKPENVCWDVTCCLKILGTPDSIPVVYVTGYKVSYEAGSHAIPKTWPERTWWQWLTAHDYPRGFMTVGYKSNSTRILRAAADGSIPDVVPANFYDAEKTYRQLTPDGK